MASSVAPAASPNSGGSLSRRAQTMHKERLLDEALAETFPASDPISPAYEARLEAQRIAAGDGDDARLRHIASSVAAGLLGVCVAAAALWLVRSLARRGPAV